LTSNVTLNVTSTPSFTSLKVNNNSVYGNGTISATIIQATTTPISGDTLIPYAQTVTSFYCHTSGANNTAGATIYLQAESRASSTPNTTGTLLFNGNGSVGCASNGTAVSTFNSTALGSLTNLVVTTTSTIPNSTTTINFSFQVNNN